MLRWHHDLGRSTVQWRGVPEGYKALEKTGMEKEMRPAMTQAWTWEDKI